MPVFDLDGTLLDSDMALVDAFVACGIPAESVTFGHVLADECARLGIAVDHYLDAYDAASAQPFPGVVDLVASLERWGVCSNKAGRSGRAELERCGWSPDVALFAEAFGGGPKRVGPVLDALGVAASEAVFVGDTAHDRACARDAGCAFVLAGWNPRASAGPGDRVARHPRDVLDALGRTTGPPLAAPSHELGRRRPSR
ncbi:MAG: HAD family hydrolase [Actinobacteria bacterium]|nr:HAD family hydrolase [Actinomycetota bacterium]